MEKASGPMMVAAAKYLRELAEAYKTTPNE